jgi:hypothetical protein
VEELRLKIHPLTLGKRKKLFDNGTIPAAFSLTESIVTTTGVIIANYKRAGKVKEYINPKLLPVNKLYDFGPSAKT